MNVDESPAYQRDWGDTSLEKMKRELGDAMSVSLIPEMFHHGIHRILEFVNGYKGSTYLDNTQDLTILMATEVVNTDTIEAPDEAYVDLDLYTLETTMGCLGLGSEFDIFSVSRSVNGDINMIDTRPNAIPFLMSVVQDYELGLFVAQRMAERGSESVATAIHQPSSTFHGHWGSIVRMVLLSTIPDGDISVPYEKALQRFADLLTSSSDSAMVEYFGSSGGFEEALKLATELGLISRSSGRIDVCRPEASMFLTRSTDKPLLEKLATDC